MGGNLCSMKSSFVLVCLALAIVSVVSEGTRLGAYRPQCRESDREFEPVQCHGSTGYCWCVDRNGAELPSTRVFGSRPTCEFMTPCRNERLSATGLIGSYRPRCDEQGEYEPIQCHGSIGFCWCVDPKGQQVGERVRGKPDCSQVVFSEESKMTPCQLKLSQSRNLIGSYKPQCLDDGSYKPTQCHGSTGMCWCVDTFGAEIANTRARGSRDCRQVTSCEVAREGTSVATGNKSQTSSSSSSGSKAGTSPSVTLLICLTVGVALIALVATIQFNSTRRTAAKRPLIGQDSIAVSPEDAAASLNEQLLDKQQP